MSRRAKTIGFVGVLLAILAGWPVLAHYRLKGKVADYRRQLAARGEKFDLNQLVPRPEPGSARAGWGLVAFSSAFFRLQRTNFPGAMQYLGDGHAIVTWQQEVLPTRESTNVWPGLCALIGELGDPLAETRAILQEPALRFNLDYSQGFYLPLPHLINLRTTAKALSAAAIVDLHERKNSRAFENLRALTALFQKAGDEPLMISELARIECGTIALNTAWEALQSCQWSDAQLLELQSGWENIDLMAQAEAALAMDRLWTAEALDRGRGSYSQLIFVSPWGGAFSNSFAELAQMGRNVMADPQGGLAELKHRYPGYWSWKFWGSYEDEWVSDQAAQAAIDWVQTARKGTSLGAAFRQYKLDLARIRERHPDAGKWVGVDFAEDPTPGPGLHRIMLVPEVMFLEIQRSLLITALAIKRYELAKGSNPPTLEALVPAYLRAIPRDVMDGQPLRYRLRPDGSFLLYSVGEDARDDGGDATLEIPQVSQKVIARSPSIRPWAAARDAVWPSPASAGQTAAEFEKIARKWHDRQ